MGVDNILPPSPSAHFVSYSLQELDKELMGKRKKINPGVSSSAHISPSYGRTSVSWRRGSRHAGRGSAWEGVRRCWWWWWGGGGVRMRKRALCMAAKRGEQASGPAQGSAPPVDKRSILSISLSAPDNKQKSSKPRSCLAFEMCIAVCYTHAVAQLNSKWDMPTNPITLIIFVCQEVSFGKHQM